MKRFMAAAGMWVGLAGCQAPWVQYPTLIPREPNAEAATFQLHDPLPDQSMGPNVGGRPPTSLIQRSEPRRTMEAAIPRIESEGSGPVGVPPDSPFTPVPDYPGMGSQRYPGTISP